jgi:hypothetical protein
MRLGHTYDDGLQMLVPGVAGAVDAASSKECTHACIWYVCMHVRAWVAHRELRPPYSHIHVRTGLTQLHRR